ncbi:MAG: 50S ribosomal protein L6 [Candidatus Woesearchaeota archaeon]
MTGPKHKDHYAYSIELPKGVSATYAHGMLEIKGAKGSVQRKFASKSMSVEVKDNIIVLNTLRAGLRAKKESHTAKAHINNMIRGASQGHTYKVIVASTHFPMNVSLQDGKIVLKNFIGEKKPRSLRVPEGVEAKINGNIIEIQSASIEKAGNFAGALEKLTIRPYFDNRIFQDGLYITEKDGKQVQ